MIDLLFLTEFATECLIIIRNIEPELNTHTWNQIFQLTSNDLKNKIGMVLIIPRSIHGQLYIVQGLHNSPHFSLGPNGTQTLIDLCQVNKVSFYNSNQKKEMTNDIPAGMYVKSVNPNNVSFTEKKYIELMKEMTHELWYSLFHPEQSRHLRASHLINLGVTNQKCDQYVRTSITGRVGLNLISTNTQKIDLSKTALSSIGKLLMYIIDFCLPATPMSKSFQGTSIFEDKYTKLFGEQLGITEAMGLNRFVFPAVSILVNQDLNPHCDSMNPREMEDDYTFSLSAQVPTNECPRDLYSLLKVSHPVSIPMCIVIYKRKALIDYARRCLNVQRYINENSLEISGRTKLIRLIESVRTHADYLGTFFDPKQRLMIHEQFTFVKRSIFVNKMCLFRESVDEMSHFSSILHMFYLYIHINGVTNDFLFGYLLFFGHQCKSTQSIVTIMNYVLSDPSLQPILQNQKYTFYSKLVTISKMLLKRGIQTNDIGGSGKHHRHATSHKCYSDSCISHYSQMLNKIFAHYSLRYKEIKRNKSLIRERFVLFNNLNCCLEESLPGIDSHRIKHMVLCASLFGILPLDFYVYVPMHLNGSTGLFMRKQMNWNKTVMALNGRTIKDKVLNWSVTTTKILQRDFTSELTPKMIQHAIGMLGRNYRRYDIHYYLPWFDKKSKQLSKPNMQFHFRVNGYKKNDFQLEVFNGKDIVTLHGSNVPSVIEYSMRSTDGLIHNAGHCVKHSILQSLL